jgi:tol-pal system protein YbgF
MNRRLHFFRVAVLAMALLNSVPARGQDNSVAANQEVRIQQLEGKIRMLNGQFEQLNFRLQQMTERLDKLVADVDFRLRKMEGGAPATANAQRQQLHQNADPAAAASAAGQAGNAGTLPDQTATNQPYALPGANADEQYQYAFDLMRQNKYAEAEQALSTFVDDYPDHPLAGNASYWLGEAYYVRKDYNNAALTFAQTFQKYPRSSKAPDSLLKLGMSLAALGETADACKALHELKTRYPKAAEGTKQRAAKAWAKSGCK